MSFAEREIRVTFTLGLGATFDGANNAVTVSGHRVSLSIEKTVGQQLGQMQMRIYGLTLDKLNLLSALTDYESVALRNKVVVEAGELGDDLATIFSGQIIVGQICMNSQPDVSLLVIAQAGALLAVKTDESLSYPANVDVAQVMQTLATAQGLKFENAGVSVILATPHLWGSPLEKIRQLGSAAETQMDYSIDDTTLVICPRNGTRTGPQPVVSPATGMIGYPDYATGVVGVTIRSIFNPLLRIMGAVTVEGSQLEVANASWKVYNLRHELESQTPGGQWVSSFDGAKYG